MWPAGENISSVNSPHLQSSDIASHYGGGRGWLAIFEEPEEAACVQHYVLSAWEPSFQRFAISLRASFIMPGIYVWFYSNGSLVQPHYTQWATGHPIDRGCVTMLLGDGIVHQGAWFDVDCVEDSGIFSVCERDKMSVTIILLSL